MDRLEQFQQDRLSAAGAPVGGAAPGAAPGLTLGRVERLPVLAAVKEGGGSVAHQGLQNRQGKVPWRIIPQHRRVTSQRPGQPEKYFFGTSLSN